MNIKNVNINVKQENNNIIIQYAREHPVKTGLTIFLGIPGSIWALICLFNYFSNAIIPDRIYLSLYETGKEVDLNQAFQVVSPINPIKENTPTILRFKLEQYNTNSPEITIISLTFPPDVIERSIKSLPADGWEWRRSNDTAITYFLNYPTSSPPAKGSDYCLPALEATFRSINNLTFNYRIVGNKIDPIDRIFKIDPDVSKSSVFSVTLFGNECNSNTVTPVVSGSTCIPSTPLKPNILQDIPTVSPDSSVIGNKGK